MPDNGVCGNVDPAAVAVAFPIEDADEGICWIIAALARQHMEGADHQRCLKEPLHNSSMCSQFEFTK